MRDQAGFDQWAGNYEQDVQRSMEEESYPFAGYDRVQDEICREILEHGAGEVLDLGFGTAKLTGRLYDGGCRIWGVDFSREMIALAQKRMPEAELIQADFRAELPEQLTGRRFDFILATYALHHVPEEGKPRLLAQLRSMLKPGGKLLIGDIAFPDRPALEACRARSGDSWDAQEFYFVLNELAPKLPFPLHFRRISFCAGILCVEA